MISFAYVGHIQASSFKWDCFITSKILLEVFVSASFMFQFKWDIWSSSTSFSPPESHQARTSPSVWRGGSSEAWPADLRYWWLRPQPKPVPDDWTKAEGTAWGNYDAPCKYIQIYKMAPISWHNKIYNKHILCNSPSSYVSVMLIYIDVTNSEGGLQTGVYLPGWGKRERRNFTVDAVTVALKEGA